LGHIDHAVVPALEEAVSGTVGDCPTLHAVQRIQLDSFDRDLHALARSVQIPPSTAFAAPIHKSKIGQVQPLHITGWQRGWLPSVLASYCGQAGCRVVVLNDSDVDYFLESVASTSPRQQQGANYVVWLGGEVTPAGLSRLLGCPQQPPLHLEVGTAAQSWADNYARQRSSCLAPTPAHFQALAGVAAPRLVSLRLEGCEYLTNRHVAMLASACPELTELRLCGASRLTDAALQLLAVGCRRLERVQLTQARVTEEGVVVALTVLGG
jgi:hypothetical protein